ncbi:hypothetical protein NM688_g8087 [Phlebia brevispora]|uniref:Uncharacterized protein n=1 Tax=Phlebia brevispora TaxID=194682 RepID=A0ACC1RXH0_9APHY|nr:hypothetical protein NM688_g8087 [Phlebia brevispora]
MLFLVGAWLLLETMNKTVFAPYATFTDHDRLTKPYSKKVIALRQSQKETRLNQGEVGSYNGSIVRLPTVALFECSVVLKYEFDEEELHSLLAFAEQTFSSNTPLPATTGPLDWSYSMDLVLDAMARCPQAAGNSILWNRHLELLVNLRDFIAAESSRIRYLVKCVNSTRTQEVVAVPFTVIPALKCITKSIVTLAKEGHLWEKQGCPSRGLVDNLAVLFTGPTVSEEKLRKECLSELESLIPNGLSQHDQNHSWSFVWRVRRHIHVHPRY